MCTRRRGLVRVVLAQIYLPRQANVWVIESGSGFFHSATHGTAEVHWSVGVFVRWVDVGAAA
jgi:hypothetical protein